MNLLKPKIIFATTDSIDMLVKAAKLENLSPKFITFDKYNGFESIHDIMSSQLNEDVANFEPVKIKDLKNTPAVIMSTSGSSGIPKKVVHSYASIEVNEIFTISEYANSKEIRILSHAKPYWMSGLFSLVKCILNKTVLIIHQDIGFIKTLRVIEQYKVNDL